jgi:hypothetical protein
MERYTDLGRHKEVFCGTFIPKITWNTHFKTKRTVEIKSMWWATSMCPEKQHKVVHKFSESEPPYWNSRHQLTEVYSYYLLGKNIRNAIYFSVYVSHLWNQNNIINFMRLLKGLNSLTSVKHFRKTKVELWEF